MAAVEVPQTLEYRGGQLNVAPVLEVENFTNWKKRFMCHILGIEPQFENIIKNGPFIPMTAGQRKPEGQWTGDERKAANLDQRLKSLIMSVLPDDQMNFYFQDSPDDEEDTRSSHEYLNDLEEEYEARALLAKSKWFFKKGTQRFISAKATDQIECHKCGKKGHFTRDCWSKISVPSYQSPFQPKPFNSSQHKPELRPTKDFEAKYNKVKAKLALLSLSASASKVVTIKNKGLIAEAYEWDEEEVSSDDNEMVEVKVLMALAEENDVIGKEGARNGECVKISMRKVHTLLEIEDNDDRKTYLDYLCINLNYVEEQRNNLLSKHRDLVHELNACKEQLLVLKQAKLDFLTMRHVNTEILKENKNLITELKELIAITETWLNSSHKVNQCISEQIPSQKVSIPSVERPWLSKDEGFILPNHDTSRILPAESQRNTTDPLIVVTNSSVIDYDSTDESSVCSTPLHPLKKVDGVEPIYGPKTIKSILRSKSTFKAKTLKGVIINKPSPAPAKGNKSSSALKVNSAPAGKLKSVKIKDDHPLAICKRIDHITCDHAEYISTMNISQHLKSLGRSSSRSKNPRSSKHFFPPCIHCGFNDHLSDDCVNYPICDICGSYDHDTHGHNRIISLRRGIKPRNPQHVMKSYETCGSTVHTTTDHNDIEWFEECDIRKPIWYLDSGCLRHMTGVKSYMHKYVKQPGPKVVFRDDSTCITEGYGSIKCNGIVFTKVAFVNGLKYNLISISQLCNAKYIV
ncbi:retrovirus-related pol polyprotein from transposon TNT 1-94 [Tanacetum coccineum]